MQPTSFKFDSKTTELLDKLKTETGSSSRAEVIRKALKLLNVAYEAEHNHKELIIQDGDGDNEQKILLW